MQPSLRPFDDFVLFHDLNAQSPTSFMIGASEQGIAFVNTISSTFLDLRLRTTHRLKLSLCLSAENVACIRYRAYLLFACFTYVSAINFLAGKGR